MNTSSWIQITDNNETAQSILHYQTLYSDALITRLVLRANWAHGFKFNYLCIGCRKEGVTAIQDIFKEHENFPSIIANNNPKYADSEVTFIVYLKADLNSATKVTYDIRKVLDIIQRQPLFSEKESADEFLQPLMIKLDRLDEQFETRINEGGS